MITMVLNSTFSVVADSRILVAPEAMTVFMGQNKLVFAVTSRWISQRASKMSHLWTPLVFVFATGVYPFSFSHSVISFSHRASIRLCFHMWCFRFCTAFCNRFPQYGAFNQLSLYIC
jgi:hypothetical protein